MSALGSWAHELVSLRRVSVRPPQWAVPGFFPPGMSMLVGDPKTFKSTLVLRLMAYLTNGMRSPDPTFKGPKKVTGTCLYWAYEQSPGRLRYHYEGRIIRGNLTHDSISIVKDPWSWRIEEGANERWCSIIEDVQPTLAVIDPLAHAHDFDENDSSWVKHLNTIRQAALRVGTAVVLVHHTNKRRDVNGDQRPDDFGRARGTSALWGMVDSGHMLTRKADKVQVSSVFKDFPARDWMFTPPR